MYLLRLLMGNTCMTHSEDVLCCCFAGLVQADSERDLVFGAELCPKGSRDTVNMKP